jgi:hypothetical protein
LPGCDIDIAVSSDAVVPSVKNVKYYFNTVLTVAGKYNISGNLADAPIQFQCLLYKI